MKTLLKKKAAASRPFKNPLEKFRPGYREVVEETKAMAPEEVTVNWVASQKQRSESGTNSHVPKVTLLSPVDGNLIAI